MTSSTLLSAAKRWASSPAPRGCDSPAVRGAIARLVPESEAVVALVRQRAADPSLKAALRTVPDTFHIVEAGCKPVKGGSH